MALKPIFPPQGRKWNKIFIYRNNINGKISFYKFRQRFSLWLQRFIVIAPSYVKTECKNLNMASVFF